MKSCFAMGCGRVVALAMTLSFSLAAPGWAAHPGAVAVPEYAVSQHFAPGGGGGWDYLTVDAAARRVYVSRGTRVQVLDADTGALIGEIADTPGVHGIAVAPQLHRGFTSNGRDSTVTVFDTRTLATIARVHLNAANPDEIRYDPESHRVFTFNGRSHDATVIDAATDSIVGTIVLGGAPEASVVDGEGHLYVDLEDQNQVVAIDTKTMAVTARWPTAPGAEPSGLAIDTAHHRLFVNCGNGQMVVLDANTGRHVAAVPIGQREDGAAFDPALGLAFSPNGEGTLTIVREVSPDSFAVAATLPTQRGARTIALDTKTHRLYSPAAEYGPPPEATTEHPHPRGSMVPESFRVLVMEPVGKR